MTQSKSKSFPCPYHGASPCTCQLVILLVYPKNCGPLRLILEGRDTETYIYLDANLDRADQPVDPLFSEVVLRTLNQNPVL